ncbi:MAG: hypothetical protein QG622_1704 [Actinomycetota bacterium]|nr:hypothetical protein [Actinomycetota bacterium]
MPAANRVDVRARRVAARLLSGRGWRTSHRSVRPDDQRQDLRMNPSPTRGAVGGHPARAARVARTLQSFEADDWVFLSRVHRPGGGRRLIDHLLVGPGGIVVVDSHPWVGRIEVTRGAVQQNGFWREAETAEVAGVAGAVAALLLPQHRTAVHAVICVAQHNLAHHVVNPGVHVVGITELAPVLRDLPHRLHPAEILQVHTLLRQLLGGPGSPEQLTTAALDRVPGPTPSAGSVGSAGSGSGHRPLDDVIVLPGGSERWTAQPTAQRAAARRRSARRPRPARRSFTARMLLAVVVALGVVLLGPAMIHRGEEGPGMGPATPSSPVMPVSGPVTPSAPAAVLR